MIDNKIGLLSVDSVDIYEAKQIPPKNIMEIEPYFKEIDFTKYNDIKYYYVGLNYTVSQENEFFYNGVKYELFAVGKIDGKDYIIGQEVVYDLDSIKQYNYEFNSSSEEKAQMVVENREKGIITNFEGEILEVLYNERAIEKYDESLYTEQIEEISKEEIIEKQIVDEEEIFDLEKAKQGKNRISTFSATSAPSTFKLYITSSGTIKNIGFDEYTKNVLPNEWYSTWKSESLKVGVIAIKTYAWYNQHILGHLLLTMEYI